MITTGKGPDDFTFEELMAPDHYWLSPQCFFSGPHGDGCSRPDRCDCVCHNKKREKEKDEVQGTKP